MANWPEHIGRSCKLQIRSGLFGVNGILIGFSWILIPEIHPVIQCILTIGGAAVSSAILIPVLVWLKQRKSHVSPFTLTYITIVWVTVLMLKMTGAYDANAARGWHAYFSGDYQQAEQAFRAVELTGYRGIALSQSGLGWALFKQSRYVESEVCFRRALDLIPGLADAHDGLGWSLFKLNLLTDAQTEFRTAVSIDPTLADSWNGLGWTLLIQGDATEAIPCFRRAVFRGPLLPDSWEGLNRALIASGQTSSENLTVIHSLLDRYVVRGLWFVNSRQLLAWSLLLIGIIIHSRRSGIVAVIGLAGALLMNHILRPDAGFDVNFYYNLIAVLVALGGQYLMFSRWTIAWMMMILMGLTLTWRLLIDCFTIMGLPVLAFPFNLVMLLTLLMFGGMSRLRQYRVPLEIAMTDPESVCQWWWRRCNVRGCWDRIERQSANQQMTPGLRADTSDETG